MRYKLSIPVIASLIVLTIMVITAFQVYWLSKNFQDEARLFTTRTNLLFRETLFRLQVEKLKMDTPVEIHIEDGGGMVRIADEAGARAQQGPRVRQVMKQTMIFAMDAMPRAAGRDSVNLHYRFNKAGPGNRVFGFMAGLDSLRDPITVKEATDRYRKVLEQEKINVGFSITTIPLDTTTRERGPFPDDFESNVVTIGFAKPLSYRLLFENNTWYLLKRIGQPILVSVFLLGVTVFSFLLLYRNLQQQRRLAQLKNDFISNMTHELKTPIATVSVAIEALRDFNALDDPQRTTEYLDISAHEMQRLGLLVDKVLKLSMFENREIALNKEEFDLVALARGVMTSMKLQFENRRAVAELQTSGKNFNITADKLHMTSVLYNLVDNALKYSIKDPKISIHIIDHTQYLEMRVTDNGIGIAREYRSRIFEKFFRVPSGDRHNIKGYGLGLSYVSHIVQRHMGFIEVESEPGRGSTFSVKLPFAEAPTVYYGQERRIGKLKTG